MDTSGTDALQEIDAAIAVIDALAGSCTSADDAGVLEAISDKLEGIKNDIISNSEQALINTLNDDTKALSDLVAQINKANTQLDNITNTINKVSTVVGTVVSVTTAAISGGIL